MKVPFTSNVLRTVIDKAYRILPWTWKNLSSISATIWKVAQGAFWGLSRKHPNPKTSSKCKEGGCEHFVDRKILKIWQKHLGSPSPPNREGFLADLQLARQLSEHQSDKIAGGKLYEKFFDNNELVVQVNEVFDTEKLTTPLREITTLSALGDSYERLFNRFGDKGLPMNTPFDPMAHGNLPYVWHHLTFHWGTLPLIRMPAATQDRSDGPVITTEFTKFIEHLQHQGKAHFYVNLMSQTSGNEAKRSRALKAFASTQPNLLYASLDKNSSMYSSGGCNAADNLQKGALFLKARRWLLDPKYHQWPISNLKIVQLVSSTMFQVEQALDLPDVVTKAQCRTIFDLVQTDLIRRIIDKLKVQSANISCKNCIDRGPCQQVLLSSWHDYLASDRIFDASRASLMLVPAWLVSGRAMQKVRFDRCLKVLETLEVRQSEKTSVGKKVEA